jgi:hypothetical protein
MNDGEAEQHQAEADLGNDIGKARAEGQADMRHQHVHDVAVIELDLDQHLAAADVVVDEIVALEVGLERALDLAGGDVEILRVLERPHDALAEADKEQQVLGRAADDPGAVRIVGELGAQRDQHAQVAHQQDGEPVGHVVAALAVEPPGRQRLQQQHGHDDDDQRPGEQRLGRMPVGEAGNAFEEVAGGGEDHVSTNALMRRPAGSPGRGRCADSAGRTDRARSCGAGG